MLGITAEYQSLNAFDTAAESCKYGVDTKEYYLAVIKEMEKWITFIFEKGCKSLLVLFIFMAYE